MTVTIGEDGSTVVVLATDEHGRVSTAEDDAAAIEGKIEATVR